MAGLRVEAESGTQFSGSDELIGVLIESLKAFSPERLYDEKTDALYIEEVLKMDQLRPTGSTSP
jgi:hypothetical protein